MLEQRAHHLTQQLQDLLDEAAIPYVGVSWRVSSFEPRCYQFYFHRWQASTGREVKHTSTTYSKVELMQLPTPKQLNWLVFPHNTAKDDTISTLTLLQQLKPENV